MFLFGKLYRNLSETVGDWELRSMRVLMDENAVQLEAYFGSTLLKYGAELEETSEAFLIPRKNWMQLKLC
ncbi:hypothetical protein V6N13_089962 [Hibiscus sabdariffa]